MISNDDKICYFNIKLPVHLRYHKNSSSNNSTIFFLNDPKLNIYCKNQIIGKNSVKFACNHKNESQCAWNELTIKKVI